MQKKITFQNVEITGGFWKIKQDMIRNTTVYAVYDRFKETYRFDALKCRNVDEVPYKADIFWDSDVAKWMEGVAYLLTMEKNPELEKIVDEAIDQIVDNSDENGYFNSHYLVMEQEDRFVKRHCHELYCAGHLIEAAVAYYHATGKDKFLNAMCKFADYIERVFKVEKSARFVTPGHPELELALIRLYEATNEERYLLLAKFFIDMHGNNDKDEKNLYANYTNEYYNMDHAPLREQSTAEGHSVRTMYLLCGMIDVAEKTKDKDLLDACRRILLNVIDKRMYVTGGIGSTHIGEAFTVDYNLPTRTAYAETCAAIALAMAAGRMQCQEINSVYADTVERIIYNGFLSGVSMDGKKFFYENPLEVDPQYNHVNRSTQKEEHYPITERKEVFWCSCCPPNVVRFIPSIANYMYTYDDEILYVHQYMESVCQYDGICIQQKTNYPASGRIEIYLNNNHKKIALRIPAWCSLFTISVDGQKIEAYTRINGYVVVKAPENGMLALDLEMPVKMIRANKKVHDIAGRICITRGPIVYCAEGIDNGSDLCCWMLDTEREIAVQHENMKFMLPTLKAKAYAPKECVSLYWEDDGAYEERDLTLIPYYAFANRGETEMVVWLLKR